MSHAVPRIFAASAAPMLLAASMAALLVGVPTAQAAPVTVAFYDFESGTQGWTASGSLNDWEYGTSKRFKAISGTKLWATSLNGEYRRGSDSRLVSPPIALPAGAAIITLSWWSIDDSGTTQRDQERVYVSADNGATWTGVHQVTRYHSQVWKPTSISLADFSGKTIRIKFHFDESSNKHTHYGWYIDDVWITSVTITTTPTLSGTRGNAGYYTSPVSVALSCTPPPTETCSSTRYKVDAAPAFSAYGAPFKVAPDGAHSVAFYSVSSGGATEPTKTVQFNIDATPPVTTASISGKLGNHGWYVSAVTVQLSARDATSGVASTTYAVNGGSPVQGTSLTLSRDGIHVLTYASTDVAGNAEAPRTLTVKVDTIAPEVLVVHPTTGNAYVNGERVPLPHLLPVTVAVGDLTVRASASDAGSGVERVEFWVDGRLRATDLEGPYVFAWETGKETLAEHVILAYAYDRAGNSQLTATSVRTVPTTPEGVQATADALAASGGAGPLAGGNRAGVPGGPGAIPAGVPV